jgi:hypothetical protein
MYLEKSLSMLTLLQVVQMGIHFGLFLSDQIPFNQPEGILLPS